MDREQMAEYGIDYDKGLRNNMGNLTFYKKILSMFLQDGCMLHAREAYAAGDRKELFNRMHEMKGISGNVALTELYNNAVTIVELLRGGGGEQAEIDSMFAAVGKSYDKACQGIEKYLSES